jgi:lysophospholipase L1-like esterase
MYEVYKTKQADIVMLGNSLTHGANWNELLDRQNVVERGIVSDVTEGFVARLRYVYKLKPKVCFILGGLNDIYNWTPIEKIYSNYIRIISSLELRGIEPVIQSTLYAGKKWGEDYLARTNPDLKAEDVNSERNSQVKLLNKMLSDYSKRNNIKFIDLNKKMSKDEFLRSDITYDGAHLNARGYKIWATEVDKVLTEMGF